jgi:transcriptional regulator with XRE-family HTH domain
VSAPCDTAAEEQAATTQLRSAASNRPGRRIRKLRLERGLSRAEVARASGFSIREILRIERGRGSLTFDDWRALAGGLGVDVSEIVPADVEPSGAVLTSTPEGGEDEVPLEMVDLELELFVGRVRDDLSGQDVVLSEALASLDIEGAGVASRPATTTHERHRNSFCASNEFRLRLAALDNLCVRFVTAEGADEPVALAAEITTAVERVRACHEFGESAHVVVPIHR